MRDEWFLVRLRNDSPMVAMRLGEADWYRGLYVFGASLEGLASFICTKEDGCPEWMQGFSL